MHAQRLYLAYPPKADNAKQSTSEAVLGYEARRVRLAELDVYLHVSVIGICLAKADLRDIVERYTGCDLAQASDFEMHLAAVQIASEGGPGADALHALLDKRYDREIRRFEHARDESELCELWSAEKRSGGIAGAYWALITHPRTTCELRQRIVGDVHGVSA